MADGSGLLDTVSAVPLSVIGFAGGGGSSVGLWKATGRAPTMAANHWLTAVLTHQGHFPDTEHYCADIFDVSPMDWRPHEPIRLGWFSPDCTDHSKAKGSAPKSERIRGLGWSVIPWAKTRKIQTIFVENVEEYVQWGPVYRCPDDWRARGVVGEVGQPIAALRGVTFLRWVRCFNRAGYWFEYRPKLNAADYGAGQTRVRFYGIAEFVGVDRVARIALGLEPSPIKWAEPTHAKRAKAEALNRLPWKGFCEFADWSQPCPSIYLTKAEVDQLRRETGRRVKRPLVRATHKRVFNGLDRYVLSAKDPYRVPAALIPVNHGGDARSYDVADPLRTVTAVAGGEFALVTPTMIAVAHGEHERRPGSRARDVGEPINAINGLGGDAAVVAASLHQLNTRDVGAPATDPVRTLAGRDHQAVQAAYLVRQFGSAVGGRDLQAPLGTATSSGGRGGGHDQFVTAYLDTYYRTSNGAGAADPAPTFTGKDRASMVVAWLEQANTGMVGHDAREPVSTIVAGGKGSGWGGATQRLIEARLELDGGPVGRRGHVLASLWEHFGFPTPEEWADPVGTLNARRKFGLVVLDGQTWMIVDLGLRMLTVREMAAASGLPPEIDLSRNVHGIAVSKTNQTQMIGNMVHPDPCAALIATQCPDLILPGWVPGIFPHPEHRRAA